MVISQRASPVYYLSQCICNITSRLLVISAVPLFQISQLVQLMPQVLFCVVIGQYFLSRVFLVNLYIFCFSYNIIHNGYHSECRMRDRICSFFRRTWSHTQSEGFMCCSDGHWLDTVFVSHLFCNCVHRLWVVACQFVWLSVFQFTYRCYFYTKTVVIKSLLLLSNTKWSSGDSIQANKLTVVINLPIARILPMYILTYTGN